MHLRLPIICLLAAAASVSWAQNTVEIGLGLREGANQELLSQLANDARVTDWTNLGTCVILNSRKTDADGIISSVAQEVRYAKELTSPAFALFSHADTNGLMQAEKEALRVFRAGYGGTNLFLLRLADPEFKMDLLRSKVEISLGITNGLSTRATNRSLTLQTNGTPRIVWQGGAEGNFMTLIARTGEITGTVFAGGRTFQLRPIGSGVHLLFEPQRRAGQREHPPGFNPVENAPPRQPVEGQRVTQLSRQAVSTSATPFELDLLVAWTPEAEQAAGGKERIEDRITLAAGELNMSFTNSGVNGSVRVVRGMKLTNYTEVHNLSVELERFRGTNDSYLDEVHKARDQSQADICVLLVKFKDYCGLAVVQAKAETAFCVVSEDCATAMVYSFAHEIGHLLGARHNPEDDPLDPPYAHGYFLTNTFATIMANDEQCGCGRVPFWSSPEVREVFPYGAQRTGSETNNNVRMLNERGPSVAAFRTAPPPPEKPRPPGNLRVLN